MSARTTSIACRARSHRVEHHGGRIAARLLDDCHAVALAPHGKLLARRCPESIACGQQDRKVACLQPFGELADRCRLAGAVDTRQHDDEWANRGDGDFPFERPYEICERIPQQRARVGVAACPAIT